MNVTYVSTLCSKRIIDEIINKYGEKPLQSVQKYHRLLCEGFARNNVSIKTISSIPLILSSNKKVLKEKEEIVNDVKYRYITTMNFKLLRHICLLFGSFIMCIKDIIKNKNTVFICDILNQSVTLGAFIACKLFRKKCIAIVTDRPIDIFKKDNIICKIQSKFDGYIFLTAAMNTNINTNNKPYLVVEGIADFGEKKSRHRKSREDKFVIMYAGGLYEKYGLKVLVEAIKQIKNNNIYLNIYGSGELEEYLKEIDDRRVKYFGVLSNDDILKKENEADLLINPRFSDSEYVKYSFPSKIIEYMYSGTPVLTTKLAGIPKEYDDYLMYIDDENAEGIRKKIVTIYNMDKAECEKIGRRAKDFVEKNKNKIVQSSKVIDFINNL